MTAFSIKYKDTEYRGDVQDWFQVTKFIDAVQGYMEKGLKLNEITFEKRDFKYTQRSSECENLEETFRSVVSGYASYWAESARYNQIEEACKCVGCWYHYSMDRREERMYEYDNLRSLLDSLKNDTEKCARFFMDFM